MYSTGLPSNNLSTHRPENRLAVFKGNIAFVRAAVPIFQASEPTRCALAPVPTILLLPVESAPF